VLPGEVTEAEQEPNSNLLRIVLSEVKAGARGPAIFIDRDGVINCRRPNDYVLEWSHFVFVPGIRSALKQLSNLRLPIIIISNQAAVGKGLLEPSDLENITAQLHQTLLKDGVFLSAAYYCPHLLGEDCSCRKPRPGLLLQAAHDFNIDLSRSIFIGDSDTDLQAAMAAGCKSVLFRSGLLTHSDSSGSVNDASVARTADELFNIAVQVLRGSHQFVSGDHPIQNPSSDT
jgi:D-glycero-D-manno-heptose 1,7-bisphosphate phosphatase